MYAKSPCIPTHLNARTTTGPWFLKTPTLSPANATPNISVTRKLELPRTSTLPAANSVTSTERAGTGYVSCVSEVGEGLGLRSAKNNVLVKAMDKSLDDVISRTDVQCDGRYYIHCAFFHVLHCSVHFIMSFICMCMLLIDSCAYLSYRLEELVNTIVADACGAVIPSFEFTFRGEFCTLDWHYDIKPITSMYGQLSNHMVKWVRTWMNPQLEDVKAYICSPYMVPILEGFLNLQPVEMLEVFIQFIRNKYPTLLEMEMTTLIVPYTCGKHETVYTLGNHGFTISIL